MNAHNRQTVTKTVLVYEAVSFTAIIFILWLDELLDFPAILLNTPPTPINWQESLFESLLIFFLGCLVIRYTRKILIRMKYLEGTLYVCASCKKIRDIDENWHHMETYIDRRADVRFSHGICPDCAEKLYPDFNPYKNHESKEQEEKIRNPVIPATPTGQS